MKRLQSSHWLVVLALVTLGWFATGNSPLWAQDAPENPEPAAIADVEVEEEAADELDAGSTAWMIVASAFVMLMVPGLALFYGGMVRRKNILGTMMHSMASLGVVGVYWVAIGYALAFGDPLIYYGELSEDGPNNSFIGFNSDYIFMHGVNPMAVDDGIPLYVFMIFQGMFAILTPALISGAFAERIRFGPYCLFIIVWVTFIYCPLCHMVWNDGFLANYRFGDARGALDFAGGTVVHISAGLAGLAGVLALRRRMGYLDHPIHPSAMVLTLLGAAMLWFGWFGFNAGSQLAADGTAGTAFVATQVAAAGAALSWMLAEWFHRGKPTALGLASGIVAGLVAVTPAAGFVDVIGGLSIGLLAGVGCYGAVLLKGVLGYDDSLDVFGIHGVGGIIGSILTGVFATMAITGDASGVGLLEGNFDQFMVQVIATVFSVVFAFVGSFIIIRLIDVIIGFGTSEEEETRGLDLSQHNESGFDFGPSIDGTPGVVKEPRPAALPPIGTARYVLVVDGVDPTELNRAWSEMWGPGGKEAEPHFKAIYPNLTTVEGNRFRFRNGDPDKMSIELRQLFTTLLPRTSLSVRKDA